jgi:hypothetical protein
MLHASAVETTKGIILFSGNSGSGKSTLAGYFHQSGYMAISDDCVLLEDGQSDVKIMPSYAGLRLWQDSHKSLFASLEGSLNMAHYSPKQRVLLNQTSQVTNNKLLAIFILDPPQDMEEVNFDLSPLSLKIGYMDLLKQTYQLDVTNVQKVSEFAWALAAIVNNVPIYQLRVPHNYNLLSDVRDAIINKVLSNS